MCVTDLVTMALQLSVTPSVKEAAAAFSKGDKRGSSFARDFAIYVAKLVCLDLEVLRKFHQQAAAMQRDGVWWLHTIAPTVSQLSKEEKEKWYSNSSGVIEDRQAGWYAFDGLDRGLTDRRMDRWMDWLEKR